MILRPYQNAAVQATYEHLRQRDDNPCVVIPTGGGKTPVMATICRDAHNWQGRVLILAHVKELLEQACDKLRTIAPDLPVGVYSAGLGRRDTEHPITVAGIQSVYNKAESLGRFDLVVVDEAHRIPPDGDGMYRTMIDELRKINPLVRVIGLTATPFRMQTGMICAPGNILNHVCYEVGVRELIVQGFLCPLRSKGTKAALDFDGLHIKAGEFKADEAEDMMISVVEQACDEIVKHSANRKSTLIFAAGVTHGVRLAGIIQSLSGSECGFVCGETPYEERDDLIRRFRDGNLRYLANVNVLTLGFDAPNVDCIALVRPTLSPGLYYQMVGRGFRTCEGKADCLVLDYGGNVERHGPVDNIRIDTKTGEVRRAPTKQCPQCDEIVSLASGTCSSCGYEFPRTPRETKHAGQASDASIIGGEPKVEVRDVYAIFYSDHPKRGHPDAPHTLQVSYRVGWREYVSEWICVEHSGWARRKAEDWWAKHTNTPTPLLASEAADIATGGGLRAPTQIEVTTTPGETFPRITDHIFAQATPPVSSAGCGHTDTVVRRSYDGTIDVMCGWCGEWLREGTEDELAAAFSDELPF